MPKIRINKEEEVNVEKPSESATPANDTVGEPAKVEVQSKKETWPEVGYTGKFHAVQWKGGYVVYNPSGQRATGVITLDQATDIVRENNRAAQIKIR